MLRIYPLLKILVLTAIVLLVSCSLNKSTIDVSDQIQIIKVNNEASVKNISIYLHKGKSHNHPTFAIWAESLNEEFIQTLFVTKSIGSGIFDHGALGEEKWDTIPGPQKRPAALPYWLHKRVPSEGGPRLPDSKHPVADALTGATPLGDAQINSGLNKISEGKIRILLEINQPWDWNEYWTNDLFDDVDYRSSCQPSLIYAVTIDLDSTNNKYYLNPIGHGHHSGDSGDLFTNLSTLTSAKDIVESVFVQISD